MNIRQLLKSFAGVQVLAFGTIGLYVMPVSPAAQERCAPQDGYRFVCGPQNAEDLVRVPGTRWIIASGMAEDASMYLVDATAKSWQPLYPGDAPRVAQNMATYGDCPGAPDPDHLETHGLNLRVDGSGRVMLFAVSHGGREAIEVFEIDTGDGRPTLTWTGCVLMPPGLAANSVASSRDGSLYATVLIHPDRTFRDLIAGENTGAVYRWSPGAAGFTRIAGTELPGNNGIEVSPDGQTLFVVSSGLRTVVAYSNTNPVRQLGTTAPRMAITPDNLHWMDDGRLLTAGTIADEPACGGDPGPDEFDIAAYAVCARGFIAIAVDPASMQTSEAARGPRTESFSNATMALPVDDELWIGTFAGDRIGVRPLD